MIKRYRSVGLLVALTCFGLFACGDGPSIFLRQGRFPITNFPLYVSFSGTNPVTSGGISKCERTGACTSFASNLGGLEGITVDSFGSVYAVKNFEATPVPVGLGTAGIVYKFKASGARDTNFVAKDENGLAFKKPRVVAVDSFDEVYVSSANSDTVPTEYYIYRVRDHARIATYTDEVTSFAFGLDDKLIVCFEVANLVHFGVGASKKVLSFNTPAGVSVDYSGRIYISEGIATTAKIYRFKQGGSASLSDATTIASDLDAPKGIAIDPAENLLYVKTPFGLVKQVRYDGITDPAKAVFASLIDGPLFIAFQKY